MQLDAQIRRAIKKSGKSRYAISVKSGISQSVLSRFMAEDDPMQISRDNLERLLPVLGLKLVLEKISDHR
jgi:transcriptional regulator with XRE-family HTH domain